MAISEEKYIEALEENRRLQRRLDDYRRRLGMVGRIAGFALDRFRLEPADVTKHWLRGVHNRLKQIKVHAN